MNLFSKEYFLSLACVFAIFVTILGFPKKSFGSDDQINSEFRVAAGMGQMERVKYLLKQGADINSRAPSSGNVPAGGTALILAVGNEQLEIVRYLISQGADVNIADKGGGTAIIYASWKGNADIVALLIAEGADVNASTRDNRTALSIAKKSGFTKIVEMLKTNPPAVDPDLTQVFTDGKNGNFQQAQSGLNKLSEDLVGNITSIDYIKIARYSAAIGFYTILTQVCSDCIDNNLDSQYGKKIFLAAQNSSVNKLSSATLIYEEIAANKPNYLPVQILLARLEMMDCLQRNQSCSEVIQTFAKALDLDTTLTVAYLDLGMLYQLLDDKNAAIGVWETSFRKAKGNDVKKVIHLLLAVLYFTEKQWAEANTQAEISRALGFTAFADDLINAIQHQVASGDFTVKAGTSSADGNVSDNINSSYRVQDYKPDFVTGLWHGITTPLRLFQFFDLHYASKNNLTTSYIIGIIFGCIILIFIGLVVFKGLKESS